MSTRSNIYLKLNKESKGKTLKFNPNMILPEYHTNYPIPDVTIPEDANYIGIYHHWDGYITGVGATLLEKYTKYDDILNLLLMGDMSTINNEMPESYRGWRNEDTPPQIYPEDFVKDTKTALQEEYAYLYEDGKWYVCYCHDDITEWLPLKEELEKCDNNE